LAVGSPFAGAQELDWPDPEPSECLSVSFHEQVAWARIRVAIDDYDPKAFEQTHDEWRDCRRIFRAIALERTADIEEVERLTAFANALADARRSPLSSDQLSPLACLQVALLGQANANLARLPSEEACKSAGYWARIAPPDEDSQAQKRGRARFIADTIKELEVQK